MFLPDMCTVRLETYTGMRLSLVIFELSLELPPKLKITEYALTG